jgi:8-oxo-dGTP pyrophosphatase MutT (NUDIX family)
VEVGDENTGDAAVAGAREHAGEFGPQTPEIFAAAEDAREHDKPALVDGRQIAIAASFRQSGTRRAHLRPAHDAGNYYLRHCFRLSFRLPFRLYLRIRRLTHGVTLGVRGAVFDNQGQVLLVKHTYIGGWHFPGGGVERQEATSDALSRELAEEAGVELTGAAELFGLYLNRNLARRDHVAFYVCRAWRQPRPPAVPNVEILDCRFFPIAALPHDTTAATRRRLSEVLFGEARSPDW